MLGESSGIVAARIEMKLVGDVARGEDFVRERSRQRRSRSRRCLRNRNKFLGRRGWRCGRENEGAVLVPENRIGGDCRRRRRVHGLEESLERRRGSQEVFR